MRSRPSLLTSALFATCLAVLTSCSGESEPPPSGDGASDTPESSDVDGGAAEPQDALTPEDIGSPPSDDADVAGPEGDVAVADDTSVLEDVPSAPDVEGDPADDAASDASADSDAPPSADAIQGDTEDTGPTVTEGPSPLPGELVITEIMFDPVGFSDANAEWFELTNTSVHDVSLAHCHLHDTGSDSVTLAEATGTTLVPAGATWLLASGNDAALNGGLSPDLVYSNFFLGNTTDEVIVTCAGQMIDTVAYDKATWPMASGRSLSLGSNTAPDAQTNDNAAAWCRASTVYMVDNFGSPGAPNSACAEPDASVDACRLVSPVDAELLVETPYIAAAVVYDEGITDLNPWVDAHPDLSAEIGIGPWGADPGTESDLFTWTPADGATTWTDTESPGWDLYEVALVAPAPGAYQVVARFSVNAGELWTLCDLTGSEDGYSAAEAGQLTTGLDPCDPNPCTSAPEPTCSEDGLHVVTSLAPGSCAVDGLEAACSFEEEMQSCAVLGGTCDGGACTDVAAVPGPGELVLTEIMPNPAGISDNQGEWFELTVLAPGPVNLEGCVLSSGTTESHTISHGGGLLAAPGDVLLFTRSSDVDLNGGLVGDYTYASLSLGNVADSLRLHCQDALIDSVTWGADLGFPLAAGESMQLSTDAYQSDANDEGSVWCGASAVYADGNTGTPGAPNPPCPVPDPCEGVLCAQPPDNTCLLGVATAYEPMGTCVGGECVYTVSVQEDCSATGVLCQAGTCLDTTDPCLPNPCVASSPAVCNGDVASSSATIGTCSADASTGEAVCEYASHDIDCATLGTTCLEGACVGVDSVPTQGSVIFTEFLTAPLQSSPSVGSWLELRNVTDGWVDLSGCVLDAEGAESAPIAPGSPAWIGPGAASLFAMSATPAFNGGLYPDHVLPASFVLPTGGSTLTLTCQDELIDAISYSAKAWGSQSGTSWQLAPDSFDANANDDPSAWCFAVSDYGKGDMGSPGEANPACPPVNAVDWCRIEAPLLPETIMLGDEVIASVAMRELPATSLSAGTDPAPAIRTQLVAGPQGEDPTVELAQWAVIEGIAASAWTGEGEQVDIDKYNGFWIPPDTGDLALVMRVTVDQGRTWTYCDKDTGAEGQDGSEDGFSVEDAILLTVSPSPCEPNPCLEPPAASCEGDTLTSYAAVGTCLVQNLEALCDYAPSALDCNLYGATCIEGACDGMPRVPEPGDVVITELMIAPEASSDDGGEWLELLNTASEAVVLDGCTLSDPSASDIHTIDPPTPFVVQPGALVVFGRTGNPAANGGTPVDYFYGQTFTMDNDTDGVTLTCDGAVIDAVVYDSLFPTITGASIQLAPSSQDATANDEAASWCPSYTPYGAGDQGTPGAPNLVCPTPTPVDWCRLQSPASLLETEGTSVTVYGRVYQASVTDASSSVDPAPLLIGQLGYGPDGSDPTQDDVDWTYLSAEPNAAWSDVFEPGNDEYQATLIIPTPGQYDYAYRFSADGGLTWTWCDLAQGAPEADGSVDGYQVAASGDLYASEGPCDPNPCVEGAPAFCSDDHLITEESPGACTPLGDTFECDFVESVTNCAAAGGTCAEGACVDIGLPPTVGDLVFTEIMSNPSDVSDANGEWLELTNVSGHKLDLAGCALHGGSSSSELPGMHYILEQSAQLVMARNDDIASNGGVIAQATFSFPLTNSEQSMTFECGDLLIDAVSYDGTYPGGAGVAMQLDIASSNAEANDQPYNWCDATEKVSATGSDLGSPGAPNSACPYVDPCLFTTCEAIPDASCEGDVLQMPTGEATCDEGVCDYPVTLIDCTETGQTCLDGACVTPTNAVDWCRLQWPLSVSVYPGETTIVYGRYFEAGLTDLTASVDESALVQAEIAFGPDGSDPSVDDAGWTLAFPADANPGWDNAEPGVDEVWAEVPSPPTGVYDFAMRITVDGGHTWTWCDTAPVAESNGSEDGYQVANAGHWETQSDPCEALACDAPPESSCEGDVRYSYAPTGTCAVEAGLAECTYEVSMLDCAAEGQACANGVCVDVAITPIAGELQLTEMMLEPSMAEAGAGWWLEYRSTSDGTLDLEGCVIQAGDQSAVLPKLESDLPAGGLVVIGSQADTTINGGYTPDVALPALILEKVAQTLSVTCDAIVIDSVTVDPALWPFTAGASLQLGAEHSDNADVESWCSSNTPYGDGDFGSPGVENEVCGP
ncbi:MAG: lamin tail domain-containing protein [Myxococcota bacterium]